MGIIYNEHICVGRGYSPDAKRSPSGPRTTLETSLDILLCYISSAIARTNFQRHPRHPSAIYMGIIWGGRSVSCTHSTVNRFLTILLLRIVPVLTVSTFMLQSRWNGWIFIISGTLQKTRTKTIKNSWNANTSSARRRPKKCPDHKPVF